MQQLLDHLMGSWKAQAIYVAAELGLADLLAKGPRSSAELSALTDSHPAALRRLLRALSSLDVCRELDDDRFELTESGSALRSDAELSLNAWSRWWGSQLWPVFGHLSYSVRTGRSARTRLLGTRGFEHLERDPATAQLFHQAALELTRLDAHEIVSNFDFSTSRQVMDLGGGAGELLRAVLENFPEVHGTLFELEHALSAARALCDESGLGERLRLLAGDFFDGVPPGADTYVLKSVLHDWDDEACHRVLRNVHAVIGEGRLLVIDHVLPERLEPCVAHQALARSDLTMLAALASAERTMSEFEALLAGAGFTVRSATPVAPTLWLIEARAQEASGGV